jgi:hypothetical protein
MDFRVKTVLISIIFINCKSVKEDNRKGIWIDTYKTSVFWSCFKESYKNDTIGKLIGKKDFILQYEVIGNWDIYDNAKIIGINNAKNIKKPTFPKFEEGDSIAFYKKNYHLQNCLQYYASKELNDIAEKEFIRFLKEEFKFE